MKIFQFSKEAGFLDICRYITRKMRVVVGLLTFRCLTWSEFPREIWDTEPFPHLVLIITWYRHHLSFYTLSYYLQISNFQIDQFRKLVYYSRAKFWCLSSSTIRKSNIFLRSILILNSRKPLEYIKIPPSINLVQTHRFENKKKEFIQHISSRKHSRPSPNRHRANIAGDVDVFRYWILILVGLSNCLLSRNTNGLVNFWNIDTTSTHSKSFLLSKNRKKRNKKIENKNISSFEKNTLLFGSFIFSTSYTPTR